MKFLSIILLLFVTLSGKAEDSNSSIKIIQPQNMSKFVGKTTTFVIKANSKDIDKITIQQENNTTISIDVTPIKKVYCEPVKLNFGANKIVVNAYKDGNIVSTTKKNLYFLSELFEGYDEDEAENYEVHYFHTQKNEDECKACHNMKSNVPTNDEALEDVTKTTCYACHKEVIANKNTHAPVANWLCLNCHNGKVGEYNMDDKGASKYLAADPISKTCFYCHDKVEEWTSRKYTHGPVNDGRCIRCHNPHGSPNEFFLRKPIWKLCTTCHAEKATGKHVVSSFVYGRNGGAHPTKDRKDPARPGRDFYCSSCHNPHGSSGIYLLRMKGSMPFNVCRRCHKK